LSPSDYYPVPALNKNLGGHKLEVDGEVETVVTQCLITQERDLQYQRAEELVSQHDKCPNCGEDCVEK
jgi:hypothetical protein